MKKKGKWVRSDTRQIKLGDNLVEPLLKQYHARYGDGDEPTSDDYIDFFEDTSKTYDPEWRLQSYEDWAKRILINEGYPANIFTAEFSQQYQNSSKEPFAPATIAKEALIQIKFARDAIESGDTGTAVVNTLNLSNRYLQYQILQLETLILRGQASTAGARKHSPSDVEEWKSTASTYCAQRNTRPSERQVYEAITQKHGISRTTARYHLKAHMGNIYRQRGWSNPP